MESPSTHTELTRYLQILRRRKWLVVSTVVLITVGTAGISLLLPKTYEASAIVQIRSQGIDTSLFSATATTGSSGSAPLAPTVLLLETSETARQAAAQLPPAMRTVAQSLLGSVDITADDAAAAITFTASASDPKRTAASANAFARVAVRQTTGRALRALDLSIRELNKQVAEASGIEREQLSRQLQRLRALRSTQDSNASIIQAAFPPGEPSSPRIATNTALAFFVSLLLAAALALTVEQLDRRLRSLEQIEETSDSSLLAAIPSDSFQNPPLIAGANGDRAANVNAPGAEAFRALRNSLLYFNVSGEVRSVLITGSSRGEGKTMVATNLAVFATHMGMTVTLIDADLHRPMVGARLGLEPDRGLADILSGQATLSEVAKTLNLGDGTLRVVLGSTPPNPSELIASKRMTELLTQAVSESDLVVLDSPPLLAVSDVLPMVDQVSGVIAVARVGQATRDSLPRLLEVVDAAGGKLFGVVGTDVRMSALYGYGYGYGYGGSEPPTARLQTRLH